jgi:hypothetical protein
MPNSRCKILPLVRSRCKKLLPPTLHDLHIFRFVLPLALQWIKSTSEQIDIPKLHG